MTLTAHFQFEYDASNEVFAVRMRGAITDDIFKASYAATPRHINGRHIRAAVTDLTEVESYDVSAAAIREVSRLPPLFPDPTPRWVVAPKDHVFGMARMFQMMSPKGRDMLHVVRSVREAYDALGVTSPRFEQLSDQI